MTGICGNITGAASRDFIVMRIIYIKNPVFALTEKKALAVNIIRHIFMFCSADMIRRKICEKSVIEMNAETL